MPRNSGGTCTRTMVGGYVAGNTALASDVNTEVNDIITMLTDSLSRSGYGGMTAALAMGSNKITGLANGSATTDAVTVGQVPGLIFASGQTVQMPFYMASPPTGWTPVDPQHDSMMRIVNHNSVGTDAGGSWQAGASHSPILNSVVTSHTHGASFTTSTESVTHSHGGLIFVGTGGTYDVAVGINSKVGQGTTQSANHTHTGSLTTDNGSSQTNWQPRYMNFCIGSRTF